MQLAKKLSPLTYVRPGLPGIATLHRDKDTTVPYQQAVRLYEALDRAAVPNKFVSISGGRHGGGVEKKDYGRRRSSWGFFVNTAFCNLPCTPILRREREFDSYPRHWRNFRSA
jgi:fermentation-respiration switch protein FrsA (DUF1100 family)